MRSDRVATTRIIQKKEICKKKEFCRQSYLSVLSMIIIEIVRALGQIVGPEDCTGARVSVSK